MPYRYRGRHRCARPYFDTLPEPATVPIPVVAEAVEPRRRPHRTANRPRPYIEAHLDSAHMGCKTHRACRSHICRGGGTRHPAPEALPANDGLDDLRQALQGPVRALLAARPDLAHPAPADVRDLARMR